MERRNLLVGLGLIFIASTLATQVDPRGARPVPQGTRGDKCATDKEWPFCTDDEWGSKCPSGCRIQGLLDQYDHQLLKRIGNIRKLLDQYRAKHRSADQVSKQTYDYLKEKLIIDSGNDNSYYDLAQSLRQRITDMKIKIDRQLRVLAALKDRVKDQVVEMQRMEVDIDIKLRSCKGSCKSYTEYQVDRESYVDLEKQIKQLDSQSAQDIESVGTLYVMKSRQLQDVVVDSIYKSKDIISGATAQQKVDLFPEVKTVQLILEEEGSSSSPATISKVPGTSYSPSTSSSSSSLPSSSSAFSSSFSSSSHSSTQPFSSTSHSSTQPFSSSSHSSTQPFSSSSHTSHSSTQPFSSSSYSSTQPFPSSSHSSTSFSSSSHSSTQPFSSSSHSSTLPFSSSSHSSTPSKSITELGGRGDGDFFGTGGAHSSTGHVSTKSVSCTKSIRRTIVHTKDGPVERTEEVMDGGPGCQGVTDLTKGGMGAFFPSLSHTSSSSSSMTTKTVHAGGAKGSLLTDSRQGFGFGSDIGLDLGAFMQSHADDDIPDFHARSVKSIRVERQADYIGKDCVEAYQNHLKGETNGLFKIKPGGTDSTEVVEVYCHQEGLMGGWLLVQQRESGVLSFNRTWAEYRKGFGSVDVRGKGEFWLGNKNLHLLTNQGETMLKVELEDWEGGVASAEYIIRVGSEEEGYPLHVSGYTGDAGDALVMPKSDMASYLSHNGMKFSTFDKDNDKWEENCAEMFGGGWWYNNCQSANLNGIYYRGSYNPEKNTPYEIENGVIWVTYKPATYSLKTVRMFIRPAAF